MEESCAGCRFFLDTGEPTGICRRYPTDVDKLVTEWCGEFKPARNVAAEMLETDVHSLFLDHALTALVRAKIRTLGQLLETPRTEIRQPNGTIDMKGIQQIVSRLAELNIGGW